MQFVEFYQMKNTGKQRMIGKVVLDSDKISFVGLPRNLVNKLSKGIRFPNLKGRIVLPKDKLEFLKILHFVFSGSYLRASKVQEKE